MSKQIIIPCLGIFSFLTANAQTVPQHIDIGVTYSLKVNETLTLKAYESIRIGEGFAMEPGSSLRLEVIPKSDDGNDLAGADISIVYPNPSANEIVVSGVYDKSPAAIFDDSGNPALKLILNGTDPVIDISPLRKGRYFLKIHDLTTRFVKE